MHELVLFPKKEKIQLPLKDADIIYYPNFLQSQEASDLFQKLLEKTKWREDEIKVFGKTYKQPRLTALYGNNGNPYSYSGITMTPLPFPSEIEKLKHQIEKKTNESFTTVLLNLYRDGNDSNGWHSDDEQELGENPVIASVSLGAKRYFHLKYKRDKKLTYKILLDHGSLLLMKGTTQENWLHQIPKSKKIKQSRINLTFRSIV
ncbi:MAG: alpha-ketoglutarate-dependent dioxygenase AlkB [Flavobacteriaceae bacterium]|nr:alpha-ketoglutarate-dependent dioxygenase AlkB [Flavobacteriaceae bacterium]